MADKTKDKKNQNSSLQSQIIRLDKLMVEKRIVTSRTQAQDLILKALVQVDGQIQMKPNFIADKDSTITILPSDDFKYVSRGGLKLEGALEHLRWDVKGLWALDVGLSTGGFSDCLLKRGIKKIVGIDVGQNQLHESLREEPRLVSLEKINARDLESYSELMNLKPEGGWDLIVMDVSFISLTLILPSVAKQAKGKVLALVKPQFEVGKEGLNKMGVVRDSSYYDKVEKKIRESALSCGFLVLDYFESPIRGKDGNLEFFIALTMNQG